MFKPLFKRNPNEIDNSYCSPISPFEFATCSNVRTKIHIKLGALGQKDISAVVMPEILTYQRTRKFLENEQSRPKATVPARSFASIGLTCRLQPCPPPELQATARCLRHCDRWYFYTVYSWLQQKSHVWRQLTIFQAVQVSLHVPQNQNKAFAAKHQLSAAEDSFRQYVLLEA